MCGRFSLTSSPDLVRATFRYVEQPNFPPRYNIAPTQPIAVVRMGDQLSDAPTSHFTLVRWGFLPSFVKDPRDYPLVINARVETLSEKPSFRHAIKRCRCIIIADAFYEWLRKDKSATPFLFRRCDHAPMGLAGVWETWVGPDGEEMDTACIITTDANKLMSPIHHRMPVILEPETFDIWLDSHHYDVNDALALARPAAEDRLEMFEISTKVNRASYDAPDVQEPASKQEPYHKPVRTRPSRRAPDGQGDLF